MSCANEAKFSITTIRLRGFDWMVNRVAGLNQSPGQSSSSRSSSRRKSATASSSLDLPALAGFLTSSMVAVGSLDEVFLGSGLGPAGLGGCVVGQRNSFHLGHRLAVVELHFEFFVVGKRGSLDLDCLEDGCIAGFGLECGGGRQRPSGLADLGHAEGDGADRELVAVFERLFAADALAVDVCSIGTAQVAKHELSADLVKLAMAPAHLRRLDADDTVVVATEAGDVVGQLECGRGASAPHDLEYIVHRRWPEGCCDAADEVIGLMESHRM